MYNVINIKLFHLVMNIGHLTLCTITLQYICYMNYKKICNYIIRDKDDK